MNNTANAPHVVELVVHNKLTWTDWFGFQGSDLTEEVVAPQGIFTRSCLLKFCSVWMLHRFWHIAAPYQAIFQTYLAIYTAIKPSCQHDAQFVLQRCCSIQAVDISCNTYAPQSTTQRSCSCSTLSGHICEPSFANPKELVVIKLVCPIFASC